ncbi:hypothetical protein ACT6NV_10540 [Robiginitalea sp. IMCC44478]|uniref:hypothetical protein n=1 Tax=Robiginitalea sp. IMCC44478 TaxID=3459122 RepID=UPI0040435684
MKNSLYFLLLLFGLQGYASPADHIKMELRFRDSVLEVKAWYTTQIQESSDTAAFLLNPAFNILEINSAKLDSFALGSREGRPFPFWKLHFRDSLKQDESREIFFHYNFDLRKNNHLDSDWIELNVDKFWFPKYGDLDRKLTYDVTIREFPTDFDLVSHMESEVIREKGAIQIRSTQPMDEVLILAGKQMEHRPYSDQITFFVNRDVPQTVIESMGEKVKNSIKYLNETFGTPDPIDSFKVVIRNCTRDEIGFQFSRGAMIITGTDFDDYGNLSHEIAHYWWTGADFMEEPWMNEAFANYSMLLVLEQFDKESAERLLDRYAQQAKGAGSVRSATLFSEKAYLTYYVKATLLLKQLESRIGKSKLQELLEYRVAKGVKTTAGFLDAIEKLADSAARDYFQSLLQDKG